MAQRKLAPDSSVPLYRQLRDFLQKDIEGGLLLPQDQLPSERELVEELEVSRITVRHALLELVQQGYLYSIPGKGFFVNEWRQTYELHGLLSFTTAIQNRDQNPSSRVLEAGRILASTALARQLSLFPGEEVVMLSRLRMIDDAPVMLQQSWLPYKHCPGLLDHDLDRISLYKVLREKYNIVLMRAETTVSARLATPQECDLLELGDNGVVLTTDQLTHNQRDQPVELTTAANHPQRHPLSLIHGNAKS